MARARRAANASPIATTVTSTRPALREKSNNIAQRRAQSKYQDDGNTDGLVKNKRVGGRKIAPPVVEDADEFCMTGAVPEGAAILEHGTSSSQDATSQESAKSDAPPPALVRTARRPPRMMRKPTKTADPNNVLDGLKQRMMETARKEAANQETPPRTSRLQPTAVTSHDNGLPSDIETSPTPPPDARQPRHRLSVCPPGSVLRVPSTPGVDLSTFALKNFRHRPRQGSMLQLVQHRTVSARTSAVHATEHDDSSAFDLGAASDEEVFQPDAEGTPVIGSGVKRGREDDSSHTSALGRLQAKKRKSEESTSRRVHARAPSTDLSSPTASATGMLSSAGVQVRTSVELDDMVQESPKSLQDDSIIPSTEQAVSEPHEELDSIMADPASSSPPPNVPDIKSMARGASAAQDSHAPATKPKRKRAKALASSTADLRGLLPKRPKRARPAAPKNIYDISSDLDDEANEMEQDDDHLALSDDLSTKHKAASRGRRKRKTQRASKTPPAPTRKATAKPHVKSPITYRRNRAASKENEEYTGSTDIDDSTLLEQREAPEAKPNSKELEDAKQRFADIDDFEMEFESVSVDSSQTWR